MTRTEFFAAVRPFAPDQRFTPPMVEALDHAADLLGLPRMDTGKRTSPEGLRIIKEAEGLRLKAYQDTGGVWTIGYGHTGPDVKPGQVITEAVADALLVEDVREAEIAVEKLFPVTNQNQFDALVSFTFNLGGGQVGESTLRRLHNEGDYAGAKAQFARWRFDNGKELAGLVKRRAAEAALYGRAS